MLPFAPARGTREVVTMPSTLSSAVPVPIRSCERLIEAVCSGRVTSMSAPGSPEPVETGPHGPLRVAAFEGEVWVFVGVVFDGVVWVFVGVVFDGVV